MFDLTDIDLQGIALMVFVALICIFAHPSFWQGFRNSKWIDELKKQEKKEEIERLLKELEDDDSKS